MIMTVPLENRFRKKTQKAKEVITAKRHGVALRIERARLASLQKRKERAAGAHEASGYLPHPIRVAYSEGVG